MSAPKLSWLLQWLNQPLEKEVSILFASGDLKVTYEHGS